MGRGIRGVDDLRFLAVREVETLGRELFDLGLARGFDERAADGTFAGGEPAAAVDDLALMKLEYWWEKFS